jgi:hypothetical protein
VRPIKELPLQGYSFILLILLKYREMIKQMMLTVLLLLLFLTAKPQIYIRTADGDSVKIEFKVDSLHRYGGNGTVTWTSTKGDYGDYKPPLIIAPKYLHAYNYSYDYSDLTFEGRQEAITDTTFGVVCIENRNFRDDVTTLHPTYTWDKAYRTIPIIDIKTTKPVVISNCVFVGAGDFIHARFPNANVTIVNCVFIGLQPTIEKHPRGSVLYAAFGKSVTVENNYFEQVRGISIEESQYNNVTIIQNKAKNIDGRFAHPGTRGASRTDPYTSRTAAYFLEVRLASVHYLNIKYNEVINYPDQSAIEDFILLNKVDFNYGRYEDNGEPPPEYQNINIDQNFFYGNWSYPFSEKNSTYTGAGVRITGVGSSSTTSTYDNVLISGKGFRIETTGTHQMLGNKKVFSHKHPKSFESNKEADNTTLQDEEDAYGVWRYSTISKGINVGPFKGVISCVEED